ncbi:MAG: hypothetical protein FVQ85_18990 [Planctomycetes bacterium]|nr:hypothetical protein [Planctomycetota bacterium]
MNRSQSLSLPQSLSQPRNPKPNQPKNSKPSRLKSPKLSRPKSPKPSRPKNPKPSQHRKLLNNQITLKQTMQSKTTHLWVTSSCSTTFWCN